MPDAPPAATGWRATGRGPAPVVLRPPEVSRCKETPRVVPETAVDGALTDAGAAAAVATPLAGALAVLTALVAEAEAVAGSGAAAGAGSAATGEPATTAPGTDGLP